MIPTRKYFSLFLLYSKFEVFSIFTTMSATFSYAQAAKGSSGSPVPTKAAPTDVQSTESKPEESSNDATPESVTTASETETPKEAEKATPSVNKEDEFTTVTSKTRSKVVHSRTSSPSVRTTKESKEIDASNTNGKADNSSEKKSQSDAKNEKSENGSEGTKDKSEKSDKSEKAEKNEKNEKPAPPKELKAAPLPSVNIWQQRKEAQDAKVKTTPASKTASGKTEEAQQDNSKSGSKKKGADGTTEGAKGSKKSDGKGRDDALPPVADASSWPTPQVALGEEKKKAQEKTEKTEKTEKSPVMRNHGKEKWMPVDYVPTAVFNTPLPSSGRGGSRRSARGGRESGRGPAHAAGEKAGSGPATPGATGKQNSGERGNNEAGPGRATSLPAQSRRSTSADVNGPEGRKTQPAERGRGARTEDAHTNGKHANGENVPRPQKQFGKHGQANSKNPNLAVDSQAASRANDRRAESGSKSADPTGFEFNNRGSRANRGGRGPFNSFNGQGSQFGNIANNNFVPKSFGGFNDRQRSHNGLANGNQQGNRMPVRSPSLPASGNMYNVYPFPADINTMYGYQAVNPAPMSAMPYQQYMEPFSLMSMLSMQLEYYFSVDNMCKDMFLRKHMDSQGFVPLGVIASFKRVKSLTEDFELIRHVSRQLRTVEYQTGEDGVDRLRPREKWGQWILPYDQREITAQHEGAAPATHSGKTDENAPFNGHGPNGSLPNGAQQFIPNGTGPRGPQTLSSTAPEFQPSMPPVAQNEIANVGHPTNSDIYPDKSPPRLCSFPSHRCIDPEVNHRPAACGLDPNPTSPPSFHHGLVVPATG